MAVITSANPATVAAMLFAVPVVYFIASYYYLARWHRKCWLFNTAVHENGRLTLLGSLFYFDHFVSHIPMIATFALCAAGGIALTARVPFDAATALRAGHLARLLMGAAFALAAVSFIGSIAFAGWQRTIDYCLQRIERDGVMSSGGLWNQLQLSNVPIALGTVGAGIAIQCALVESSHANDVSLLIGGILLIAAAVAIMVSMSLMTWQSWAALRNPRWLAHSMREVATFPLTGVPIALGAVGLVQNALGGSATWSVRFGALSLILIGLGVLIVAIEFVLIRGVDILAIAQKPLFAGERMTLPYLLASHVFEHALDFIFIGLFAGGAYALAYRLALA